MRLIDADALRQKIRQEMKTLSFSEPKEQVKRLTFQKALLFIKEQPTIEQPTWISCAERLPDGNEVVLGWSELTRDTFTVTEHYFSGFRVTHWMPIPQPPKENTDA